MASQFDFSNAMVPLKEQIRRRTGELKSTTSSNRLLD